MLDQVTVSEFEGVLNEIMILEEGEIRIPLQVVEVNRLPKPANTTIYAPDGRPLTLRSDPFSVILAGPIDQPLPQRMYVITHEKLGKFEGLFLVPVGIGEHGRTYESIFG